MDSKLLLSEYQDLKEKGMLAEYSPSGRQPNEGDTIWVYWPRGKFLMSRAFKTTFESIAFRDGVFYINLLQNGKTQIYIKRISDKDKSWLLFKGPNTSQQQKYFLRTQIEIPSLDALTISAAAEESGGTRRRRRRRRKTRKQNAIR